MVAMSIRFTGFVRPSSLRAARYCSQVLCIPASAKVTPSMVVRKVVWRQWSDQ